MNGGSRDGRIDGWMVLRQVDGWFGDHGWKNG